MKYSEDGHKSNRNYNLRLNIIQNIEYSEDGHKSDRNYNLRLNIIQNIEYSKNGHQDPSWKENLSN